MSLSMLYIKLISLTLVMMVLFGSGFLIGCNGKDPLNRNQDPLVDHPEAKSYVPPYEPPPVPPLIKYVSLDAQQPTQYVRPSLFAVDVVSDTYIHRTLNFSENKTNSYELRLRNFQPGAHLQLIAKDAPQGIQLTHKIPPHVSEDEADPKIWILTWTPPAGTVPRITADNPWATAQEKMTFEVVVLDSSTEEAKRIFSGTEKQVEFAALVYPTQEKPRILKVEFVGIEDSLFIEGQDVSLVIEIEDPSSSPNLPPRVTFDYNHANFSPENPRVPAHIAVLPQNLNQPPGRLLEQGKWRFQYTFDPGKVAELARENGFKETEILNAEMQIYVTNEIYQTYTQDDIILQIQLQNNDNQETEEI